MSLLAGNLRLLRIGGRGECRSGRRIRRRIYNTVGCYYILLWEIKVESSTFTLSFPFFVSLTALLFGMYLPAVITKEERKGTGQSFGVSFCLNLYHVWLAGSRASCRLARGLSMMMYHVLLYCLLFSIVFL